MQNGTSFKTILKGVFIMNDLMIFEEHEVEVFELNGEVLFNPYHVGECLELSGEAVRKAVSRMNEKQVIKVRNSDVTNSNIRKLNNAGENFLTESGVYKLVFKSRKPNAEKFTDWVTDEVLPTLRKTGYYEVPKKKEDKKEKLPSVNQMVKNIKGALHDAGVDSKYIVAEIVRIYSDNGYPVKVPLISDVPALWDCTTMAKELGIFSESGRPHDKAISAIIQKLDIFTEEIVKTAYSRNGHDGVTVQYKDSVLQKAKEWLEENGYPTMIEYRLSNGNINKCKVVYQEVA
jgi:prophage antirepressor-like protein